jgi:small GTP-binding protein
MDKYDFRVKYIILGDMGVGKSNILLRYVNNTFEIGHDSTIGVDFVSKIEEYKDIKYKLQIWDTAGQENFKSITQLYYKNTAVAFLVYSLNKESSYKHVNEWLEDLQKYAQNEDILVYIVGNKSDLATFEPNENTCIVSAKTGDGIKELFEESIKDVHMLLQTKMELIGVKKNEEVFIPKKRCWC